MYDSKAGGWKENSQQLDWVDQVLSWKKLGLGVVGGCCRTIPADIEKVHRLLVKNDSQEDRKKSK